MLATNKIRAYDETLLSQTFDLDIENGNLTIDNTGDAFTFNNGDKVTLLLQRNVGMFIRETSDNLYLTILNIGRDLKKKLTAFEWNKAHMKLASDLGEGYCAQATLLLATDLLRGLPVFHSDFSAHLIFLLKKMAITGINQEFKQELSGSNLTVKLRSGVFEIVNYDGTIMFSTNDPSKLTSQVYSSVMVRSMAA